MDVLFLCIGSEKISGDAVGPIVGSLLRDKYKLPYPVIGTEEHPVNGINFKEYQKVIKDRFPFHRIIAIDSAVGDELWTLKIKEGGVRAGGALKPDGEKFGDIGILAVVGSKEGNVMHNLLSAPYDKVYAIAARIAKMIVATFCPEHRDASLGNATFSLCSR